MLEIGLGFVAAVLGLYAVRSMAILAVFRRPKRAREARIEDRIAPSLMSDRAASSALL